MNPAEGNFADGVLSALFERRVVLVRGPLDPPRASETVAALMTLEGSGDDHVELRLNASDGVLEAGLMVIDMIDTLGVPVHTVGMGVVGGGAVGVLAAGSERVLAPSARLCLREPDLTAAGRAHEIERVLADHADRRERFLARLARDTGRSTEEIGTEWSVRRFLDAEDAVTLGYVDAVARQR